MTAPDILKRISEATLIRVADRRTRPFPVRPASLPKPRRGTLVAALKRPTPQHAPRFLCEIKRASPSKGVLRENFDPEALAAEYAHAGADALSVLTEPDFFQGAAEHLTQARLASGLPCLAKDFILDAWQIEEAAALGASGVLLIAALLPDAEMNWLLGTARVFGLDALIEVHDEAELDRALAAGADLIGINHRDLHTFEVDVTLTERLRPKIPANVTVVSESGIASEEDAVRLAATGVDALLIGEHFMRDEHPGEALFQLRRATDVASAGAPSVRVKICGVARVDDARVVARAGADFMGIVLCDGPRRRSLDEARFILAAAREGRPSMRLLAVTQDPDDAEVRATLAAGFDGLQLHGSETEDRVAELRAAYPRAILWKALAIETERDLERAEGYRGANALVLEAGKRGQRIAIPPKALAALAARRPIVLAGGLTPDNVDSAIHDVRPWAVDVSSGVESAPAHKDRSRVMAFVSRAREAQRP